MGLFFKFIQKIRHLPSGTYRTYHLPSFNKINIIIWKNLWLTYGKLYFLKILALFQAKSYI